MSKHPMICSKVDLPEPEAPVIAVISPFWMERDIKLKKEMRNELVKIAEMKGRYEGEVQDMEWAKQVIPFLRYPDKVDDHDFKLASSVVGCIDKWLPGQNLGFPWQVKWGDITRHVQSKRTQLR